MRRRTFLKTSAAAATVLTAGAGIQGCGNGADESDGTAALDPSKTHKARFVFRQPVFDTAALLQSLPQAQRVELEAWMSSGGPCDSISTAESFIFHAGGSKVMERSLQSTGRDGTATKLHIVTNEFSTDKASIIYVTHRRKTERDGSDEGLSFMYLYVPSAESSVSPPCDGNAAGDSCEVTVDVDIGDPVYETVKAMLFLHPELHQIRADRARLLLSRIDITSLQDYALLHTWLSAGMDKDIWYESSKLQNPDDQSDMVFEYGINKGRTIRQFIPVGQILEKLRVPMRDLVRRVGNDPELAGIFRHDTTATDATDVTRNRMQRFVKSRAESSADTVTLQDHSERDGYAVELLRDDQTTYKEAFGAGQLPDDAPVVKLRLKNHYRRYIAFYIQYRDLDGNVIQAKLKDATTGKSAWSMIGGNFYSKGIYDDYMDDTTYLLKLLSQPAELLSIPIEKYTTGEVRFAIPDEAHSVDIYAVTMGSGGKRVPLMEHLPVGMTWTFDLIIPVFLLAGSFAIRNENKWLQLVANFGLKFALAFINYLIMLSADGTGLTADKLMKLAGKAGTAILLQMIRKGVEEIAIFLVEEITEESIEDSTPILGAALMVGNIAVDVSEIVQTGCAINNSAWSSSFTLSRTHRVEVQVLPDENNFQFPEAADTAVLILKSPEGKVNKSVRLQKAKEAKNVPVSRIDGVPASGTPLFNPDAADTTEAIFYTFDGVPEGGKIDVIVLFTAGKAGYVVGHAKYRIENVGNVKTALRITQIKIALSDKSVYAHKRIVRYDQGELKWIETATPPSAVYNLASDGTEAGQISNLLSIAVNDKSGALGYSFTTEIAGEFKTIAKNISAKADVPEEGYKEKKYPNDTNAFVLYDMLSEPKTENINYILQLKYDPVLKQNTYFAKPVSIDPSSADFGISATENRGKFRVAIDAAAYDATHGMVAGLDYTHRRLHILTLSEKALYDDDLTHNGSVYSVPRNIVGVSGGSDFRTLKDILYNPRAIAFAANGALMVVDQTPIGDYARMFSSNGTALNYTPFGGFYKPLKRESVRVTYLDLSVDADGYFFVLKRLGGGAAPEDYKLDLYAPDGTHLSQTGGMTAHKMRSDFWRNIYTLNYERTGKDGSYSEPTLSIWVPPVTGGKVVSDYE